MTSKSLAFHCEMDMNQLT